MLRVCALLAASCCFAQAAAVRVVVAQDGSGDFKTVQSAVDHALDARPLPAGERLIIEIRPGTYRERVKIPPDRPRLSLLGSDAERTVITFNAGAKDFGGTFFSSTVDVEAAEFEASGLTFENSYGTGTQAVAIALHSDRAVFRKCRFIGWQDTLYAASGRQFYRDCYIEGHVDFIFGNAAAVFERCEIHSRATGYVTAQSRLTADSPTGFVFSHCRLTGEGQVYLGRPWRDYSRVVYLHCWMGEQILPAGWDNWKKPNAEATSFYGEYESEGPGADQSQRVAWQHALSARQAEDFNTSIFLRGGDNWRPR